jgi:transmembrane sensor
MSTLNAQSVDDGLPFELSQIQQQGLDWIALAVSGKATKADLQAMAHWGAQCQAHADALAFATKLRKLGRSHQYPGSQQFPPSLLERPMTRRFALAGGAAAAVGYAMMRPPLNLWPSAAELASDYRTDTGEHRSVALANGLSMELNTRTSVALRSQQNRPGIHLIAGEIAVTAKLPSSQIFVAFAGGGNVSARNASFNLRTTDDGFQATCLDGTIRVANDVNQLDLRHGETVVLTENTIGKPIASDTNVVEAWRHGQLIFYDARLSEIVAEINRYRPGRIVIANAKLADRRFNSTFRIAYTQNVVADLQRLAGASVTRLPGGVVLLS